MNYYELIRFLIKESLDRGIKPKSLILDKSTTTNLLIDCMTNLQHLDGRSVKEITKYVEDKELKVICLFGVEIAIEQNTETELPSKIHIELK